MKAAWKERKQAHGGFKPVALLTVCVAALAGILVVSVLSAGIFFTGNVKTVLISDGCALYELTTECTTVGEALAAAGITVCGDRVLNCSPEDPLTDGAMIRIEPAPAPEESGSAGIDTLIQFTKPAEPEESGDPADSVIPEPEEPSAETPVPEEHEPVTTLEYEDILEEIGYGTKYIEDTGMYEGDTRVAVKGENGIVTHVYEITVVDGVEISRRLVKTKDTKAPVDEVIAYGTISNFINSRGQKISFSKRLDSVATAYTYSEKWHDVLYYGDQLGGLRARWGVIAVDPNVIPLGTKVYVKSVGGVADYGFAIAADIGGSIKGNKIDLWMDNAEVTFRWGVRPVEVYVLADQSLDIFELRQDDTWG